MKKFLDLILEVRYSYFTVFNVIFFMSNLHSFFNTFDKLNLFLCLFHCVILFFSMSYDSRTKRIEMVDFAFNSYFVGKKNGKALCQRLKDLENEEIFEEE